MIGLLRNAVPFRKSALRQGIPAICVGRAHFAASVTLKSKEMLMPQSDQDVSVKFTMFDVLLSPQLMSKVWYYPNGLDDVKLKKYFIGLMKHYPIIAGRWSGKGTEVVVSPSEGLGGVPFDVGETSSKFSDWKDMLDENMTYPDLVHTLYTGGEMGDWVSATGGGTPEQRRNSALFSVRITHEVNGSGSWLGICGSHALHDGGACDQLIHDWGRLAQGIPIKPPSHDRQEFCAAAVGMWKDWDGARETVQQTAAALKGVPMLTHPLRTHHFSKERRLALKNAVSAKMPSGKWVSTADCIEAYHWLITMHVQSRTAPFASAVNLRGRSKALPSLGEEGSLFGVCLLFCVTPAPESLPSFTLESVALLALSIRESLKDFLAGSENTLKKTKAEGVMENVAAMSDGQPIIVTNHFSFNWLTDADFSDPVHPENTLGKPGYYKSFTTVGMKSPVPVINAIIEHTLVDDGVDLGVWATPEQGQQYKERHDELSAICS